MSRKLHDTKNDFKSRNILAFCLFVVLGILSVACVTKAVKRKRSSKSIYGL